MGGWELKTLVGGGQTAYLMRVEDAYRGSQTVCLHAELNGSTLISGFSCLIGPLS